MDLITPLIKAAVDLLTHVLAQARRPDGAAIWMRATGNAPVSESEAEAYIFRQRKRDPDLWVIEIETGAVAELLESPILAA